MILIFTVVTSITCAADIEFRKSKYLKVIWMMIFQMMIAWFGTTSIILTNSYLLIFLVVFLLFIFMCLCPVSIHIWLSTNFRHTRGGFAKMTKVLIPQQYATFIQNDKQYGYKYQLIDSSTSNSNNNNNNANTTNEKDTNVNGNDINHMITSDNKETNEHMDKYWKFQTNNSCVIKCIKNRNISDSKQVIRLYFLTFFLWCYVL